MTTTFPPSSNPPAQASTGAVAWLRKNLFNSIPNSILSVVLLGTLAWFVLSFVKWATTTAKWTVIPANWPLYFVGRYPADQHWRLWAILALIGILSGLSWGILSRNVAKLYGYGPLAVIGVAALFAVIMPTPVLYRVALLAVIGLLVASAWVGQQMGRSQPEFGKWVSFAWMASFFVVMWLLAGGLGLKPVSTNNWGGLTLTLFVSVVSILLCFPLGVLLALGRQSSLPVIRLLSVLYIEIIRGVPLIAILFIGQNMIPLFLPQGIRPANVLRAIIGLTLFSAAYLAENVRGGLQAIPRGQVEAANALGLNPALATALIVLPQALKISIPAIVGQFISLFQDTTLLSIVSILELLGISRAILANPNFIGRYWEVYLFIGAIFWVFCYLMSLASRRLERSLNTGR
ncbi:MULTISPECIES: amino acid ABC transporter permease [unclassified Leptolyngbya]|uniref:amino acid ABC transporter permease n=1 Tax=unclassified Leptolyngbya TaxID=2650499 RepID=UPI0016827BA4|nr:MULTISPECIES: amino acid ABC transporter permease [unclassified Leptolyngbya]MBD1912665.1 amino acid ABC transporter permease [Leptolyngbya sp. FACHB-8]MBD2154712.1 amino acid ABC transporter permease [Leptolyngbya sp. FACHB-16]